ncbi:MAG: DcrB-related protein [bacterium]
MGMYNENHQFRLGLPDGWDDQTIHFFQGPEEFGLLHNLTLMIDADPPCDDLDEYVSGQLDHTLGSLPDAEVLKEETRRRPDGLAVRAVTLLWRPPSKTPEIKKLYYMEKDGVFYNFSAPFTKQTLKTLAVEIDRMIDQLEFPAA